MVKKSKALGKANDKQLATAVRSSAQQIWQAGLGAFAKAQEEGGKVFAKLVKDGTDLQKRSRHLAEDKVAGVSDNVTKMAESVSKHAAGSWDKLEQVFEDRVSRSLSSLGVPSQKDLQRLTKRIEELSSAVAALSGKKSAVETVPASIPKPAPKKPVARAPASRTVTKKAAPQAAVKPAAKSAVKKPAAKAPIKTAAKKPATKTVATEPLTVVLPTKSSAP